VPPSDIEKGGAAPVESGVPASVPEQPAPPRAPRRRMKWSRSWINVGRALLFVVFIGGWQLAAKSGLVDPYFVSTPSAVARFLGDYSTSGKLWGNLSVTLRETLLGFVIGGAGGILVGLVLARFPVLDALLDPFLTVINSLPRVALAPLFLLWFGLGTVSKVILAISLVFFILVINTRVGVRNVDPDLVTVGKLLGAREHQLFRSVILPAALPSILAGLRLGVIYSLLGTVVGEMIAAEAGIGQQLTYFSGTFQTAGVIAMLLILACIAALLDALTVFAESRLLRWQSKGRM
jgi:NitT/TauT family transport system permease protein